MGSQAPQQGQLEYQARPFSDIVVDAGSKWEALKPNEKVDVLDAYLQNRETKDPQFAKLDDQQKLEVKTVFVKKFIFNQPVETPQLKQQGNPLDALPGLVAGAAETGGYITQPVEKLLNTGVQRYEATKQPSYQINPYFRAGADVGRFGSMAAGTVLGATGAGLAGLGEIGAGMVGAGALSANENIQRALGGEQNAGQAGFNIALDTLTGGIANKAKSILGAAGIDAAVGGAGSGLGYIGNQLLGGGQIDPKALLEALKTGALTGGAIGAGVKAAHGGPLLPSRPPQERMIKTRSGEMVPLSQAVKMQARGLPQAELQREQLGHAKTLQGRIEKRQQEILNSQSVTEQKTYQDKLNQLGRIYKGLDETSRAPEWIVASRAEAMKGKVQAEYNRVKAEYEAKYPKQKPKEAKKTAKPGQLPTMVKLGVKAVKQGGSGRKRFKEAIKKYDSATQDKVNRGIEQTLKAEKQRSQADQQRAAIRREAGKQRAQEIEAQRKAEAKELDAKVKAAEKAASQKPKGDPERKKLEAAIAKAKERTARYAEKEEAAARKKEMGALKADIKARSEGKERTEKLKAQAKQAGYEPAQSQQGMSKMLAKAKKKNTVALVEYEAEIAGERESSTYKFKSDTVVSTPYADQNGNLIYKVINENGQLTTRHIHDETHGSRTLSVTNTDEPAPYKLNDAGDVVEVATGKVIEQTKEATHKSSTIRAALEGEAFSRAVTKFKQKKASVSDIVNAAKPVKDTELEQLYLDLEAPEKQQVYEGSTGDPC